MSNLFSKILGDKKQWKAMEARAEALPREYGVVYEEIKKYMWRFASGDGQDVIAVLETVLVDFEAGAAEGKPVLAVTGDDVAAFCDERLGGANPFESYLQKARTSLNEEVKKKI